jgi:hypothetical protein
VGCKQPSQAIYHNLSNVALLLLLFLFAVSLLLLLMQQRKDGSRSKRLLSPDSFAGIRQQIQAALRREAETTTPAGS